MGAFLYKITVSVQIKNLKVDNLISSSFVGFVFPDSLRIGPFLLVHRSLGRFARRFKSGDELGEMASFAG